MPTAKIWRPLLGSQIDFDVERCIDCTHCALGTWGQPEFICDLYAPDTYCKIYNEHREWDCSHFTPKKKNTMTIQEYKKEFVELFKR